MLVDRVMSVHFVTVPAVSVLAPSAVIVQASALLSLCFENRPAEMLGIGVAVNVFVGLAAIDVPAPTVSVSVLRQEQTTFY